TTAGTTRSEAEAHERRTKPKLIAWTTTAPLEPARVGAWRIDNRLPIHVPRIQRYRIPLHAPAGPYHLLRRRRWSNKVAAILDERTDKIVIARIAWLRHVLLVVGRDGRIAKRRERSAGIWPIHHGECAGWVEGERLQLASRINQIRAVVADV